MTWALFIMATLVITYAVPSNANDAGDNKRMFTIRNAAQPFWRKCPPGFSREYQPAKLYVSENGLCKYRDGEMNFYMIPKKVATKGLTFLQAPRRRNQCPNEAECRYEQQGDECQARCKNFSKCPPGAPREYQLAKFYFETRDGLCEYHDRKRNHFFIPKTTDKCPKEGECRYEKHGHECAVRCINLKAIAKPLSDSFWYLDG